MKVGIAFIIINSIYSFFIYISVHDQNFKKILRAMKDGMDWPEERLDVGKPARTLFQSLG